MGADIQPYAWLILFAAFMGLFLNSSLNYSSGVIHVALLQKYPEEDVTNIAWLGSLFSCMFAFTGILASVIINTFNVRVCVMASGIFTVVGFTMSYFVQDFKLLFLTYGLIGGCGQGLCHTGCLVSLGYYFKEKIGMVSGIALSGCGLCMFVFPPLTQFLFDTYGINGAFLILGGIGFQATMLGSLMTPTKYEKHTSRRLCRKSHDGNKDYLIKKKSVHQTAGSGLALFRSFSVWGLMISTFCFSMALSTVYLLLPEYFIHHGSSKQEAALVLSVCGVTGIISRVMVGFLSSSFDVSVVYSTLFGITATVTLCLKVMTSLASKMTYTAMFGMYVGGCWVLHYNLVVECVGLDQLSTCYGLVMMIGGIGYLVGPPIAGKV
ncbi:hypothetical protein LOTGIDRAFT_167154 [Lottia gigantea]|uniref:Major facilitator superfamily (MFS) profile domain-containing protein n=1 Tax=Lottia gigantea TaxID=225164 RepID=V3ZUW9_LOTGI|nr:hypothetical protein LOTGIDRAFT_167154 [Lottia gigantea]ESO86340.1 hypothetical protein LOTGIDRAFT_167154 [Lottia gigantea]